MYKYFGVNNRRGRTYEKNKFNRIERNFEVNFFQLKEQSREIARMPHYSNYSNSFDSEWRRIQVVIMVICTLTIVYLTLTDGDLLRFLF